MVDDFDVVLLDEDPHADEEEPMRPPPSPDPEEPDDWHSDFRSYLDDPA